MTSQTNPGATGTSGPSGKAGLTTYSYDAAGNLTSEKNPLGTTLVFSYDNLSRETGEYNGSVSGANQLAAWTYDTAPLNNGTAGTLGEPASSVAYGTGGTSGPAYKEIVTGYDNAYQATGTETDIPASALVPGASGTSKYTNATTYKSLTGTLNTVAYSADAGLPQETVGYAFTLQGLISGIGTTSSDYLDATSYTPQGQILSTTFGPYGNQVVQDYNPDPTTGRLLSSTSGYQPDGVTDITYYTYDQAGNVTSTADVQPAILNVQPAASQTQCDSYDHLGELVTAWTDTGGSTASTNPNGTPPAGGIGGCVNTTPSAANIGGPAPYWQAYAYDTLGDRTSATIYDTALPPSQDTLANATVQNIAYPGGTLTSPPTTAQPQPNAPTSIVTTSPGGATTTTPKFDAAGDTTKLTSTAAGSSPPPGPPALTGLTYTKQGQTSQVTTAAGASAYI